MLKNLNSKCLANYVNEMLYIYIYISYLKLTLPTHRTVLGSGFWSGFCSRNFMTHLCTPSQGSDESFDAWLPQCSSQGQMVVRDINAFTKTQLTHIQHKEIILAVLLLSMQGDYFSFFVIS